MCSNTPSILLTLANCCLQTSYVDNGLPTRQFSSCTHHKSLYIQLIDVCSRLWITQLIIRNLPLRYPNLSGLLLSQIAWKWSSRYGSELLLCMKYHIQLYSKFPCHWWSHLDRYKHGQWGEKRSKHSPNNSDSSQSLGNKFRLGSHCHHWSLTASYECETLGVALYLCLSHPYLLVDEPCHISCNNSSGCGLRKQFRTFQNPWILNIYEAAIVDVIWWVRRVNMHA